MTDEELDRMERVTIKTASEYLNRERSANDIRLFAQKGECPFAHYERKPGAKLGRVHINVGLLKAYRRGELPLMGAK
nr:MAG TPA: hypothetical protein [Caudoviricetes sp.]